MVRLKLDARWMRGVQDRMQNRMGLEMGLEMGMGMDACLMFLILYCTSGVQITHHETLPLPCPSADGHID